MNNKNIISILASVLCVALMASCSKDHSDDVKEGLPPVVESLSTKLAVSGEVSVGTRSLNENDPTKTECHLRCSEAHTLTVTIGSDDTNNALYTYDNIGGKWIPASTGVRFPDFNNHNVKLRLCGGFTDPIAKQIDGSATNLLHADVLVAELSNQSPTKELPAATMSHLHTLFDIRFGSSLTAADINSVKINNTLVPYNVKVSGVKGHNYLVIVAPGNSDYTLSMTYKGVDYTCVVKAQDVQGAAFAKHTRYVLQMDIQGNELVCGGISVKPWDESAGSAIEIGPTKFKITGYENKTLDVKIGNQVFSNILSLDSNGEGSLPFLPLDDYGAQVIYIHYNQAGHQQIPIGKPLGSDISMTVNPSTGDIISIP